MEQPGRQYTAGSSYRYGFNGKENDNEVKGEGNQQDYGMRIYDPRLGRFLSVDPIADDYPQLSPYQFASNQPIESIDLDGLERFDFKGLKGKDGTIQLQKDYTVSDKNWTNLFRTKYSIPPHIRIEYNGQHYIFSDGTKHKDIYAIPSASDYSQYPGAVNYMSDYSKFISNPEEFSSSHLSEEQARMKVDELMAKIDQDVAVVEMVASLVAASAGSKIGSGRPPRIPKINIPRTRTSVIKAAVRQKAVSSTNISLKNIDGGSILPRTERLLMLKTSLEKAQNQSNPKAVIKLINQTLNEIENKYSGKNDRMFGILDDKYVTYNSDGSVTALTKGHRIEIATNGSFSIFERGTNKLFLKKEK